MFVTPNIVFVEVPKTGSTYIDQIMIDLLEGDKIGKHNYPSEDLLNSDRKFIASIRNPFDWYVSLWAYGCKVKKRSGPYQKTTSWRPFCLNGYGLDKDLAGGLRSYIKYLTQGPFENRQLWRDCYRTQTDHTLFGDWTKLIFDPRKTYLYNALLSRSAIGEFVGLYTFRYLWLTCRNRLDLLSSNCPRTIDQLIDWEAKNSYIDYFIHMENMSEELCYALNHHGHKLNAKQESCIQAGGRRNASARERDLSTYYDRATEQIVREREQLIFSKFQYSECIPSIT